MNPVCYLNGTIQPLTEARLDPLDRGNLFGDALYEAVKVLDGVLLHFEPHRERLAAGLERVGIPLPKDLRNICEQLLVESRLEAGYLYLQISRGVQSRLLIPPPDMIPTVLVVPFPLRFDPPAGKLKRVTTAPDWRWQFRDIKTTSLMATVLGKLQAGRHRVDEVLFIGSDGEVREGGTTNFFARRANALETHPTDGCILAGVTRGLVIDLARGERFPVREHAPQLAEIESWQEAFLTGTTTGVQPVVEIDGRQIGDGSPGHWTRRLAENLEVLEAEMVAAATAR